MYTRITSIAACSHDSSYGGYPFKVEVTVRMCSKEWAKARAKNQLGQLYGIDISNAVFAFNRNIDASNPTVNDTKRASKGEKLITLTYYMRDLDKAEKLGLKVKRVSSWNEKVTEEFLEFGTANILFNKDIPIYLERKPEVAVTTYEGVSALRRIYG